MVPECWPKSEFNLFTKVEYWLSERITAFGDLQFRHIDYDLNGIDDDLEELNGQFNYSFLNPKAGISYRADKQNTLYASVAVGQRERPGRPEGWHKRGSHKPHQAGAHGRL